MDAPPLTSERSRELATLRRRAYGPDADIATDADALERLHELETLARASITSAQLSHDVETTDEETPEARVEVDPMTTDAMPPAPAESHRPWWRRIPAWAIAGVSVVVGIVIGAAAVSLTIPQPDRTLHISPQAGERAPNWARELSSWGLDAGSVVPYGDYDGVGVWLVRSDDGSACILLEDNGSPYTASCAQGGLDPILDIMTYPEMVSIFDSDRPTGSVIRFIARGSTIDVWERRAQESAAPETSWSDSAPKVA